jgi:hypothetical protein
MEVRRENEVTEFKGVVHVLQDRTSVPPPLLYKCCAFNEWTPRIFQNNELYFRSPNDFNDPFDSIVKFISKGSRQQRKRVFEDNWQRNDLDLSRRQRQTLTKHYKTQRGSDELAGELEDRLETIRRQAGMCCMTEKKDDILMWSHYAGRHSGFCLEFRTDDPFFSNARPVSYSGTLPCANVLLPGLDEVTTKGLLTKAKEWEYEREWRIIDLRIDARVRQFPPAVLHGVILGCRILDNDKQQVVERCKARSPRPILYEARRKKMEYGLDIEPIEY